MRVFVVFITVVAALGLGACTSSNGNSRGDSAARQAGRTAYEVTQKTKQAANKAGRELRKAGEQAREGWNEAKRESQSGGHK
jgi:Flp pilus assembly protein TadB